MKKLEELPNTYFGLATFGDKNIAGTDQSTKQPHTLGFKSDHCLRVNMPLQPPNATEVLKHFRRYQRKGPRPGDSPGAFLEAVYRALIACY